MEGGLAGRVEEEGEDVGGGGDDGKVQVGDPWTTFFAFETCIRIVAGDEVEEDANSLVLKLWIAVRVVCSG